MPRRFPDAHNHPEEIIHTPGNTPGLMSKVCGMVPVLYVGQLQHQLVIYRSTLVYPGAHVVGLCGGTHGRLISMEHLHSCGGYFGQ